MNEFALKTRFDELEKGVFKRLAMLGQLKYLKMTVVDSVEMCVRTEILS